MEKNRTFIKMRNITKLFPGVIALDSVDFDCRLGEVHAVMGENGAGKSTLMKIVAGVYQPDGGEILIEDKPVQLPTPHSAQEMGISIIHQELNLLPDLSVAENVFLGREPRSAFGWLNGKELESRATEVLGRLGVDIDPRTKVSRLSVAKQQMVEIAKALSVNAQLVIMDEPSATLGGKDLQHVFDVIAALKSQGVAVIYISHRLGEVYDVADWVTIFRDGKVVTSRALAEVKRNDLVNMMIGRKFTETFPPRSQSIGEKMLSVENVSCEGVLHDINLSVRSGEVLGISGLMGSGRSELAQAIFGVRPLNSGRITINSQPVQITSPQLAMDHSIGYLPESRKEEGFVTGQSVRRNATLPSLDQRQRFGFIEWQKDQEVVNENVSALRIKTPSIKQEVQFLSGGNQQKVVLSKWLITGSDILIFDEPTRGIDVGAKAEIWKLMRDLADDGKAIIMISSDLPEVIGMSDRIVVMRRGRIEGIVDGATATEESVLTLATYGADNDE